MSEILEVEDDGKVVILGESPTGDDKISYQLAQSFYHEITGKSEKKTERHVMPFILTLDNINQLKIRLDQYIEQFHICTLTEQYSVKHVNDSSERFSSLEKLKLQISGSGVAVEEFSAQYNILIILPKTRKPQEYKLSVELISRVAKIESMREDIEDSNFPFPLHHFEQIKTAVFSIDYIDVSVANGFISLTNNWFKTLEKNELNGFVRLLRKNSKFFPALFKYGFLGLAASSTYLLSSKYIIQSELDLKVAALFILFSILGSFIFYRLGSFLGDKTEQNINNIYEQSYINFSVADKNYLAKSSSRIRTNKIRAIISTVFALTLGVASSLITSWLGVN